ncbi:hypothetical protein pC_0001 [Aeromonas phage phiA050]
MLADFPTGEIAKAATTWYSQKPTPKTFLVGAIINDTTTAATPGTLTGNTAAVLSTIKAETAAVLTAEINGVSKSTAAMDFSSADDLDAVVIQVNAALTAASMDVVASQVSGKFKLSTVATGSNATVTNASGKAAEVLKLGSVSNPTAIHGVAEKSIAGDLANILNAPYSWFYVGLDRKYRDDQSAADNQMTVAKWAEGANKVFGWADDNTNILVAGTDNSFKRAKTQNLQRSILVYDASVNGDEYPEVAILARAATVNFNVANSALVLAFKKGPGITTADLSPNQMAALQQVNGNAFINVAGNVMFYDGKMADGTWFDTVQGVSWLTSKIQVNVFNLFYQSTTKIPWTDTGVAMVNQQVTLALELARTNGLIAPGYDNEGVFYPDGYKVISTPLELLQSEKGKRIWEGTSFIAIGSGALQGATITGSFVQ